MMNSSPPTRHERRRQQTRNLLIQTTVQLVLEKGFDAISIQDITDRADLGRGTFYIHFKDKEEVVWAAIRGPVLELEQELHQQYKDSIPDQPEYYSLRNIFQHVDRNRDLYRVSFGERGSARLNRRMKDLLAAITLNDLQSHPEILAPTMEVPVEIIAQMMTGLINHMIVWWLDTPNDYTAEQMAEMIYQTLYHKEPPRVDS